MITMRSPSYCNKFALLLAAAASVITSTDATTTSAFQPSSSLPLLIRPSRITNKLYASSNTEEEENNNILINNNNDDNNDDDSYISKRLGHQTSWAYSGLTNAWGYSARLVTKRERRRYERRRIRHRRKVEMKSYNNNNSDSINSKRLNNWMSRVMEDDIMIGAGDAFVGNVKKGDDFGRTPKTTTTTGGGGTENANGDTNDNNKFDDDEMDEDGYWNMLGKKRSIFKQLLRIPYRALSGEYRTVEPGTLILVRHGESLWNANKTFTGWANPDLSPQGYREVEHAARLLLEGGYKVDVVFTSRLKRAIRSSWILLRELNEVYLPVFKSWRLNERMYGALTGLSKTETAERLGPKLVQEWRGSLKSRPPPLTPADKYYPGRDRSHADLTPDQIPLTESLLDCMDRTKKIWVDKISYELACGKNVMVVAHANTLRGLVKIIDGIGDEEIQSIAIPTGIPIIYKFDKNLDPIPPSQDQKTVTQVHMNGCFLEKPGLLKLAIKREEEWCNNVPDYSKVMERTNYGLNPLQRSLTKLDAERKVQDWAQQFADDSEEEEDDGSDGKLTLVDMDKVWEEGMKEVEDGEYFDPDRPSFEAEPNNGEEGGTATSGNDDEDEIVANMYNGDRTCVTVDPLPAARKVPGIGDVPIQRSSSVIVMIRHGKTENNKLGKETKNNVHFRLNHALRGNL
jgi:2,3-bisphosphoglycerate-dependent phosphoglycerate mutase